MFTNIMVVIFARKLRLTYEVLTTIDFGSYVCTSSGRLSIIRFIFIGVLDSSTDLH